MSIDLGYAWRTLVDSWPMFWYGIKITLGFAVVGTVCGFLIGLVIGAIRSIPIDPLDSAPVRWLKKPAAGLRDSTSGFSAVHP